jgi:hypothetical protein
MILSVKIKKHSKLMKKIFKNFEKSIINKKKKGIIYINKKNFSKKKKKILNYLKYFSSLKLNNQIFKIIGKDKILSSVKNFKIFSRNFKKKKIKKNKLSNYFFPIKIIAKNTVALKSLIFKIEEKENNRIGFVFQKKKKSSLLFIPYKFIFCFFCFPKKGKNFKIKFFNLKQNYLFLQLIHVTFNKNLNFKKKKKKKTFKKYKFKNYSFKKLIKIIKISIDIFKKLLIKYKNQEKLKNLLIEIPIYSYKEKNFFGLFLFLLKNQKLIDFDQFLNYFIFSIDNFFKNPFNNILTIFRKIYFDIFFLKNFCYTIFCEKLRIMKNI